MLHTPLGRLRVIGFIEGCSFLVLLFIAMPLKYIADIKMAVTIVGALHGGLFVLFCLSVLEVTARRPWRTGWTLQFWAATAVASLVPFGTFVLDRWLKRIEKADAVQSVM